MGERLKAVTRWATCAFIPGLITFLALGLAYEQGRHAGQREMRDAVMCVMDRVSGQPIGKGLSDYCKRIGERK